MCDTGLEDISEDPLDCRGGAGYGNVPEIRERTDCVFREKNVHFSFTFIIIFTFFCIELNFRITKL